MRIIVKPSGPDSPTFLAPAEEVQFAIGQEDLFPYITGVINTVEDNSRDSRGNISTRSYWGEGESILQHGVQKSMIGLNGAIVLGRQHESDKPILSEFFSKSGRTDNDPSGLMNHKGARYYASVDPSLTYQERMGFILEDINDAVKALKDGNASQNYLEVLGIADYLRSHLSTIYHAYTYQDRYTLNTSEEYLERRDGLYKLMEQVTRDYFLVLIGHQSNLDLSVFDADSTISDVINEMESWTKVVLKMPEIEDSMRILAFADLVTDRHPKIDCVVASPSGGTVTAIVTKLMYDLKYPVTDTGITLLPISTHSASRIIPGQESTDSAHITRFIESNKIKLKNKSVLFVDDNSNTGETLKLAERAILEEMGASSVICRVVEADPIRIQIKSNSADKQLVPNPTVYESSVGFVPITRGAGPLDHDRQLIKLQRLRVLSRYYRESIASSKTPEEVNIKPEAVTKPPETELEIKVCGVHNIDDALTCVVNGVRDLGIHLTYEPEEYFEKALKYTDPRILVKLNKIREFYKERDLPIPWLELESIREMVDKLDEIDEEVNLFLLMRPQNGMDVIRMLQMIMPEGTKQKITIQLQNEYSSELVSDVRDTLDNEGYENVSIVQMLALDESDIEGKIERINQDGNINGVLLDSKKIGGTGEVANIQDITKVLASINTRKYLAGGLSGENIHLILTELKNQGVSIDGLDLESSVELAESSLTINGDGKIVKVRKDREKVRGFVSQVELFEYSQIPLKTTRFWKALKKGWEYAKNQTGYYNLHAVAEGFWSSAIELGIELSHGETNKDEFIREFVKAATTYPMIPSMVRDKLEEGEEVDEFQEGSANGWLNEGVGNLFSVIAGVPGVRTMVWTAGDALVDGYTPAQSFRMCDEQRLRYEASGLDRLTKQILGEDSIPIFHAHPDKFQIFEESDIDLESHKTIYVFDDKEENLEKLSAFFISKGITNYQMVHVEGSLNNYLGYLENLKEGDLVIMDMDDVLLKEDFRRYHQPRNILKHLTRLGLYHE